MDFLTDPVLLPSQWQFAGQRGEIHELISNYATSIGVQFKFGEKVVDYVDEGTESVDRKVGALCESGVKYMGDVVLCCDGPKSLARVKVLGLEDNKVNSGYAIYRAFYDLTPEMRKNIHISRFCGECLSRGVCREQSDIVINTAVTMRNVSYRS